MSFWTGTHWEPEAPPPAPARPSKRRHAFEAITEGALLSLMIVALVAGTAFARGSGTITVPDGVYGETVTATVNPGGTGSWARASCNQDGEVVYVEYVRVNADNHATFTLGPTPSWEGGDAACVAEELKLRSNGSFRVLASTEFSVAG
jgi:hypothetical protein